MKVELAKMAGFCFGVNRAVDTVYQEAVEHSPVYTYGPIIHNEEVIADLKRKGVQVIHSLEEAKEQAEGTVIIRSHGVTKAGTGNIGRRRTACDRCYLPICKKNPPAGAGIFG